MLVRLQAEMLGSPRAALAPASCVPRGAEPASPGPQPSSEGLHTWLCPVAGESLRDVSVVTLDSGPPLISLRCPRNVTVCLSGLEYTVRGARLTPVSQVGPAPLSY